MFEKQSCSDLRAGGGIGSAVARAFANEGARFFLRSARAAVEAVAKGIVAPAVR